MALRQIEFSAAKTWELRGSLEQAPFACVDPGADGAVVVCKRLGLTADGLIGKPDLIYPLSVGLGLIGSELVNAGVRLVVVEAQHSKMNNATALKLARGAGMIPAFLAGSYAGATSPIQASRNPLLCMWLHPASWQNTLRRIEGSPKLGKGDGKRLAKLYGERVLGGDGRYVGSTKAQRGGILDAVAMAIWVQRVLYFSESVAA